MPNRIVIAGAVVLLCLALLSVLYGRCVFTVCCLGDSAGGALALCTAMKARDMGLPMPAGIRSV